MVKTDWSKLMISDRSQKLTDVGKSSQNIRQHLLINFGRNSVERNKLHKKISFAYFTFIDSFLHKPPGHWQKCASST